MNRMQPRKFDKEKYDYYVKEYIRKSEELGKPISHANLRKDPYNLPDARWYIDNCPDNNVNSWSDFVDWCGFVAPYKHPSKEKMIKLLKIDMIKEKLAIFHLNLKRLLLQFLDL